MLITFKNIDYNCTIMTLLESIVAIVVGVTTIIASAALGIKWLTKHYFDEIKHELKPNSGTSIKDQVTRLEKDITDLKSQNQKGEEYHEKLDSKIDHLTEVFVNYISRQN